MAEGRGLEPLVEALDPVLLAHGYAGQGHGAGQSHTPGNPPGNNGTVKIAGPGDEVGHPSNNPHPGCTFYVEWFGFDEGADVVSTVTFASQAPTSDVVPERVM